MQEVKEEQPANAPPRIEVSDEGKGGREVKEQPWNAPLPIEVSDEGSDCIETIILQFL
jgi:hypothetical protein